MPKNENIWFGTCPTRTRVESGIVRNVDVLVIGGGIAGITTLCSLVAAGITNTYLVEESSVGAHASGRSSGQLMLRGKKLFHEYGNKAGKTYLDFVLKNNARLLNVLRNTEFDTDIRESGGLRLASDEQEMESLILEQDFLSRHAGVECVVLDQGAVNALMKGTPFVGGLFVPGEATFNPYKVVQGIRDFVERKGNRVLTGCQVGSVVEDSRGLAVSIRHKGVIRAKKVVYCVNAYSSELLPELDEFLNPFRGQMIASEILEADQLQSVPSMSMSTNNCSEYFRMYGGRLLVGGMRHGVRGNQNGIVSDGEVSPGVYEKLKGFVKEWVPSIGGVKFDSTWTGIMCGTQDDLPLVGRLPDRNNQFVSCGFNGYGFSHVVESSAILTSIIKNGSSTSDAAKLFDPKRFF